MTPLRGLLPVNQESKVDLGDLDGTVLESEGSSGRCQIVVEGWPVFLRPPPFHTDPLGEGVKLFVRTVCDHVAPEVTVAFTDATSERSMRSVVMVASKEQGIDVDCHARSQLTHGRVLEWLRCRT